jgi:hypothetical protein
MISVINHRSDDQDQLQQGDVNAGNPAPSWINIFKNI